MTYYAIRHIPTGHFLQVPETQRSATWSEVGTKRPPRLFTRLQPARHALSLWLKGGITVTYDYGTDTPDWRVKPQAHRIASEMEIIPVQITGPTVQVIMYGDYPESVWATPELAEKEVQRLRAKHETQYAGVALRPFIHLKIHPFEVQNAPI